MKVVDHAHDSARRAYPAATSADLPLFEESPGKWRETERRKTRLGGCAAAWLSQRRHSL